MSAKWTAADLPGLSGRTAIVTGGNSGIGFVAARELARAGAQVTLAVRNTGKGADAAAKIGANASVRELDLASLDSVRAFAAGVEGPIDFLINNAGVMAVPQSQTADGFEMQIGTNHLGHFALTGLLLDRVTDRIVTVSSGAHRIGKIRTNDLNWQSGSYKRWPAYGQSKLANLLFTFELQRKLAAAGSDVRATAAHPGYASTNLQFHTASIQDKIMAVGNKVLAQSADMGALPTLFAATQDIPGGAYVGPSGFMEQRGHPHLVGCTSSAQDTAVAARLWELSEELTGVTYSFGAGVPAA
ncbi:FabG-like 3-oxoacyl-(acyl-carrier-protein) reductase [Paraconexibacter sp. AEG42_29]|uniref:FabG-like 3-oxoacyl-(Acyl-carrier-protein) reductase n=1 Tax=Paraconexibacter sp. AEG42_29 TaxID=2997339 RepID=A0AAU7AXD5_9ACTN